MIRTLPILLLPLLSSLGFSQSFEDSIPAPPSRILDLGEIFRDNPQQLQSLSHAFQKLHQDHGYSLYLVTYNGVIGQSISIRAQDFRTRWFQPGEEGIIFTCDTAARRVAFALSYTPTLTNDFDNPRFLVQDHELEQTLRKLQTDLNPDLNSATFVFTLGHSLTKEISTLIEQSQLPPPKTSNTPLFFIALAVLTLASGSYLFHLHLQKKQKTEASLVRIPLPKIPVQKRLGAECGSGVGATIQFRPPHQPKSQ
ncbi:MAG: hypothetical protein AAGC74_07370 [Verrucomicrobiota bacterium]